MFINNSEDLKKVLKDIKVNNNEVFLNVKINKGELLVISNYGTVKNVITNKQEDVHNIENKLYVKIGSDFYLIAFLVIYHFISDTSNFYNISLIDNNYENLHISNIKFSVR